MSARKWCRNCHKRIRLSTHGFWFHVLTGDIPCDLHAEPETER